MKKTHMIKMIKYEEIKPKVMKNDHMWPNPTESLSQNYQKVPKAA